MIKLTRRSLLTALAAVLLMSFSARGQKPGAEYKNKYKDAEVVQFDVQPDVKFPQENMEGMMGEIVQELQKIRNWRGVHRHMPELLVGWSVKPQDRSPLRKRSLGDT